MTSNKCRYDDLGTVDFSRRGMNTGWTRLKDLINEVEQTPEGKLKMDEARKWVKETFYGEDK